MADVIPFPNSVDCSHIEYPFPDGAKLTLDAGDRPLTVEYVVYMLEFIRHDILTKMGMP